MNKEVVEELIQSNCNSKKIANSLNKILATSLLVEAFLYEEQTRRGISIKHFI